MKQPQYLISRRLAAVLLFLLIVCAAPLTSRAAAAGPAALAALTGKDFHGGAAEIVGGSYAGVSGINLVYSHATGAEGIMSATFSLAEAPTAAQKLYVEARDDDSDTPCPVAVLLNDTVIYSGSGAFPKTAFGVKSFDIPAGAFKDGTNTLTIENTAAHGSVGVPPWFMVARCWIAPAGFVAPKSADAAPSDKSIVVPQKADSFVERANAGEQASGFKIRGTKGWGWTPAQYLEEIPYLAQYHMNFLMNCYSSMFSTPPAAGVPGLGRNNWWEPIPDAKKSAYDKVFKECRDNHINFCFSLNPQLATSRPFDPNKPQDFADLWRHYAWAQSQGVQWFSLSLDDVSGVKIDGAEHAAMANKLLAKLREKDPNAQLILCPTYYAGDGTAPAQKAYLEPLAANLDPDIYLFWTGPSVVPQRISLQDAQIFKGIVKHKVILWDNYPVNDGGLALHLGPLTGRDAALPTVLDGYMSNPMFTENEINRIPLFTLADYAFNPAKYDPSESIGQAIWHNGDTRDQRQVLKDLVEMFSAGPEGTGTNDLIAQYKRVTDYPGSGYVGALLIDHAKDVLSRLSRYFPHKYAATKTMLTATIAQMQGL